MGPELLREAVRRANELHLDVRLEDPDRKESHPGKSLSRHVQECSELSDLVCEIFGLEGRYSRFSKIVCALHDLGKLHPSWGFGVRDIRHSVVSSEILSRLKGEGVLGEITGLSEEEQDLLIFMVRKHHSSLRVSRKGGYEQFMAISWLEDEPEAAVGYADAFGAFKLADFASANDMVVRVGDLLEKNWPKPDSIISLLGEIDESRFSLQMEISRHMGHVALAAPTGWGKTMVGILSAINGSPVKLFYSLPTITAIRKMKEEMERLFSQNDPERGAEAVGEYFYFVDVDLLRGADGDSEEDEGRVLDFYRLFIPKVNITTVDQVLLSLMRAGKYHMRRFELRNSVLVFDEYHLLPAAMIGALAEVLRWYTRQYNMKVILMTATPLSAYREALVGSIGQVRTFDLSGEYSKFRRHRMEFIDRLEDGISLVEGLVREGKRVLVVLNRVRRTMDFYDRLDVPGKVLLHSRFTVNDRYDKEGRIRNCRVLVATQVAEVSLDVSFNAMVTDLAPIPAVIQRAGRVNRYGESEVNEPNIYVMMGVESSRPYDDIEMRFSSLVLEEMAGKLWEEGESAYLEMLREYDSLIHDPLLRKVETFRRMVREAVFDGNQLLALDVDEERLARELRGETNVMVVPATFEERVRELFARRREATSYGERMRFWAEIKGYMVPVKLWLAVKHGRQEPGIPIPIVGEDGSVYDPELGLLLE